MMAQVEAREKRKLLHSKTNADAADVIEVTIDEAVENGKILRHALLGFRVSFSQPQQLVMLPRHRAHAIGSSQMSRLLISVFCRGRFTSKHMNQFGVPLLQKVKLFSNVRYAPIVS